MTPIEKVRTFITAYLYDDDDGKTAELLRELEGMVIVPVEPSVETLDRSVAFALNVTLSGEYSWTKYMDDLYATMIAPYVPEEKK